MSISDIRSLPSWSQLQQLADKHITLDSLFDTEPDRTSKFSLSLDSLTVDYSRQRLDADIQTALIALAEQRQLQQAIEQLFAGDIVNQSEQRPALHTALRTPVGQNSPVADDIIADVNTELDRLDDFVSKLHAGKIVGENGQVINTLVNIGIGGSDLGPRMAHRALTHGKKLLIDVHFVANIDAHDIHSVFQKINPETTLFILSSKSCTTKETLTNVHTATQWLNANGIKKAENHFVAVTANVQAAKKLGIADTRIFHFRAWVGGRYSLWSVIGLPLAAAIGMPAFRQLLAGAHAMDEHFRMQPFEKNIPVMLALLDIWNINFHDCGTLAIVPYCEPLSLLPDHLCQLFMESNGKSVTQDNTPVNCHTSPVILGGTGTNAQHAFFQMLHQGTRTIPVEFIVGLTDELQAGEHQPQLFANCLAQAEALMSGRRDADKPVSQQLAGNKPSTLIIFDKLDAYTLGMLIALYEHRVFVQASLWGINAFDQWGVELGKTIATKISDALGNNAASSDYHSATAYWIRRYHEINDKEK